MAVYVVRFVLFHCFALLAGLLDFVDDMLISLAVVVTSSHFFASVDCFLLNLFVIFVVRLCLLALQILLRALLFVLLSLREVVCDAVDSLLGRTTLFIF